MIAWWRRPKWNPLLRCAGRQTRGFWKGYECGASPKFIMPDGRTYCHEHVPLDTGRAKILA